MALIPWWIRYPNVNDEIMNLDWLLRVSNENTEKISNFINLNTIKYADPILWDITSQYEANTITVDPQTGDAYISTKAVPYGVSLSNTDYWTKIYNYADEINELQEQIAAANEELSTTATAPRAVGDLVWLNGLLYKVTAPMIAGDSYIVDSNCVKTTIEKELNLWINNVKTQIGSLSDLDTSDKSNLVSAVNEVLDTIGNITSLTTTDKSSIVGAINEVVSSRTKSYVLVSDMIADTELVDGEIVKTLGYSSAGVGAATYKISATAGSAAISLSNGLYANIILSDIVDLASLGATEGGDITNILPIAFSIINGGTIVLNGNYKISEPVSITLSVGKLFTIEGNEYELDCNINSGIALTFTGSGANNGINIRNIAFKGHSNIADCLEFKNFTSQLNRSELFNINFYDFKQCITFTESRLFFINNCSFWNINNGILFDGKDSFSGDSEITNSQFSHKNNVGTSIGFKADDSAGQVCGITIQNCDFYPCDYRLDFANGFIADIWILNNQFDGTGEDIRFYSTSGNDSIANIQIKNNYATAPKKFITWYTPNKPSIAVDISGNYVNGNDATQFTINFNSNSDSEIRIDNNNFVNCKLASEQLINITSIKSLSACGNKFDLSSDNSSYGSIKASNISNAIVCNNLSYNITGVAYNITGTNTVVNNNLPT